MNRTTLGAVLLPLLTFCTLGGGCTTYRAFDGPSRPDTEIAVLSVPLTRINLDGRPIEEDLVTSIELLPGDHLIEWDYSYPNGYLVTRRLVFAADAGCRYRLGQRFFPAPNPGGPIGAVVDLAVELAFAPFSILVPGPEATEAPKGEYYCWIRDVRDDRVVAGLPPDVPRPHQAITYLPLDDSGEH